MNPKKPAVFALVTLLLALAVAISWTVSKSKLFHEKLGTTKGVAVLPFENLSPDPDNAYYAEGIYEEILARLATIHDLKVISRNSTQQYQRTTERSGHCEAARRIEHTRRQCAKRGRSVAGQRAAD
jgi:TolB-like protein